MPIIVDANAASEVFNPACGGELKPVHLAIWHGRLTAVHGGKLSEELGRLHRLGSVIQELSRAGRLRKVNDQKVNSEEVVVKESGLCRSNDPHIIALARISQVRLLCSKDQLLHRDFKNPRLLKPSGQIYQNTSHVKLLQKHRG